jgi:hypothetical protein
MKVGVSGHQNVPAAALTFVRNGIIRTLSETNDDVLGITSLAAGADQIFANVVLERGGQLHVVIPSLEYEESFHGARERREYARLLQRAESAETLDFPAPSEEAFLAAGRRVVELSDVMILVWDGRPARGKGGTADIGEYAQELGRRLQILWPAGIER